MSFAADQYRVFYERCIIMGTIREYLLSITAAAIICAVVRQMFGKDRPIGKLIKIISGLFMVVTVLSPLLEFRLDDWIGQTEDLVVQGDPYVEEGVSHAESAMSDIIKQQLEEYILDEAERLCVKIRAEVTLRDDGTFTPEGVVLKGEISPYSKQALSEYIVQTLGITEENQKWI